PFGLTGCRIISKNHFTARADHYSFPRNDDLIRNELIDQYLYFHAIIKPVPLFLKGSQDPNQSVLIHHRNNSVYGGMDGLKLSGQRSDHKSLSLLQILQI